MLGGKVCVVTGAARGMGRECALEMARQQAAAVICLDINGAGTTDTAQAVAEHGVESLGRSCDITQSADVRGVMEEIGAAFGRIDVLHNNAGILESNLTDRTSVADLPEAVWDRMFEVNVRGMWLCTKYAVPWLRQSEAAAIVNCGSTSSFVAFPTEACYCATKAAVVSLTKSTALDLSEDNIRCNCYCPSSTETEMLSAVFAAEEDAHKVRDELAASHLVHRLGRPEDVAKLVCFLASDDASFINGAALLVDGGALAWRGLRQRNNA